MVEISQSEPLSSTVTNTLTKEEKEAIEEIEEELLALQEKIAMSTDLSEDNKMSLVQEINLEQEKLDEASATPDAYNDLLDSKLLQFDEMEKKAIRQKEPVKEDKRKLFVNTL